MVRDSRGLEGFRFLPLDICVFADGCGPQALNPKPLTLNPKLLSPKIRCGFRVEGAFEGPKALFVKTLNPKP